MSERDGSDEWGKRQEDPKGAEVVHTWRINVDRSGMSADERELLEAFDRLAPAGNVDWAFDDAMRRLSSPGERATWIEPWDGLPADLWDRGRAAKAAERALGDVIRAVAQDLTEYTQRIVDDVRRTTPEESTVVDAFRYLAARVDRLESLIDPLGIRPAELDLPMPDVAEWAGDLSTWLGDTTGLPIVVGESGARPVIDAAVDLGAQVDAVDPRGQVVWALGHAFSGSSGQVEVTLADVADHLRTMDPESRSGVVLSGCVDRVALAGKVDLVDAALRALAPGGVLIVLTMDQAAWDERLAPAVRDLLPGRPFHPQTWALVLRHRGSGVPEVHLAANGTVHAIVARKAR